MSSIVLSSNASGTAVFTLASPATSTDRTLTLPDVTGTVLVGVTSASTTNTITNKVQVNIGGVVYYLLASTSST